MVFYQRIVHSAHKYLKYKHPVAECTYFSSTNSSNAMSSAVLFPREAGKFVAERSRDVKISSPGITETAKKLHSIIKNKESELTVDRWRLHDLNPKTQDEAAVDWVFVSDLLNFSFWSENDNKYAVRYGGKEWTGYWSLCAAMNRALDEGIAITDPKVYSKFTMHDLQHVFRSDSNTPMPLLNERLQGLQSAGHVLLQKYNGSFVNVVRSCNGSTKELLARIVHDFETFRDEVEFEGQTVGFYKRAQILIGDIWACCGGKGIGAFNDIYSITMFADYRIPQALVWFGALSYSENLMELLNKNHLFKYGDRQEVEIRGCSIWAVELIVEELKKLMESDPVHLDQMNAILIDHFMWDYRREHDSEMNDVPFHKTRCIFY